MSEEKGLSLNTMLENSIEIPLPATEPPKCLMLIASTDQALVKDFATRLSTRLGSDCDTFITEGSGTRYLPQVFYSAFLSSPDSCSDSYLLSTLAELEDELTEPGAMNKAYDLKDWDEEDEDEDV